MKYSLIFVAVYLVTVQAIEIPKGTKEKFLATMKKCLEKSKVDVQDLIKLKDGVFTDDPKLKAHLLCTNKEAGVQNNKGELQIEFLKKKLHLYMKENPQKAEELIRKCLVQKSTPEDTAFELTKCVYNVLPSEDRSALLGM